MGTWIIEYRFLRGLGQWSITCLPHTEDRNAALLACRSWENQYPESEYRARYYVPSDRDELDITPGVLGGVPPRKRGGSRELEDI